MECMIYGLPFQTVAVVIVVPLVFAALLVWWGMTYTPSDKAADTTGKGRKS